MSTSRPLIPIALILALSSACGRPAFRPVHIRGVDAAIYLSESALITAGTADRVEEVGWRIHEAGSSQPLQLYRITVSPTEVLKGKTVPSKISVYAFVSRASVGGSPRMWFDEGQNYIFYLNKESGEWRSACDISAKCFEAIKTGIHPIWTGEPEPPPDPKEPLARRILRVLLTRGSQATDGSVVDALEASNGLYGSNWTEDYAEIYINILQETARTETPPVAAEACALLAARGKPCKPCGPQ